MEPWAKIQPATCPECRARMNAIGTMDGSEFRQPRPGEAIACMTCGAVVTMGADGAIRGFTEAEMEALINDRETMTQLALGVAQIHFVRQVIAARNN